VFQRRRVKRKTTPGACENLYVCVAYKWKASALRECWGWSQVAWTSRPLWRERPRSRTQEVLNSPWERKSREAEGEKQEGAGRMHA